MMGATNLSFPVADRLSQGPPCIALVTMAFEPRFAVVLVGSSGEGGAKPHRRHFGEAVESLTGSGQYHWMAGNFLKYGAAEASFGSKNANDIPAKMPPHDTGLLEGELAWRQHDGGHEDRSNMSFFIAWANRLLHHTPPLVPAF